MHEQFTLFDTPADDPADCKYPHLAPATAYRYGCRCPRCVAHKRGESPGHWCMEPGCVQMRQKHRRYCAAHGRPDNRPGLAVPLVQQVGDCQACRQPHGWYESEVVRGWRIDRRDIPRSICKPCRVPYIGVITAHKLNLAWAVRAVTTVRCEICQELFPEIRGRRQFHVDHDHACCPGQTSCGRCVRGIICARCNMVVGAAEIIAREIGAQKIADYLARYDWR